MKCVKCGAKFVKSDTVLVALRKGNVYVVPVALTEYVVDEQTITLVNVKFVCPICGAVYARRG